MKMNQVDLDAGMDKYPIPDDYFTNPNHTAARMFRDLFAPEAVATTMEARTLQRAASSCGWILRLF